MSDRSQPKTPQLVPPALLDPVVTYFNPRRVIVFGSFARGEAGPDSDIDLLVIVDDDTPADRVTLKAGYQSRKSYHQPADVIPVRERIYQRNSRIAGTLSRAAMLDGSSCMNDPDPPTRWRRVEGWIHHAADDARIARGCLGLDPPANGGAAYHCQQAAEKLLKGFLVLAGIDFRRTHDLDTLADSVLRHFPTLRALLTTIGASTAWGVAYRYPADQRLWTRSRNSIPCCDPTLPRVASAGHEPREHRHAG
jgi:uncharacterized protein